MGDDGRVAHVAHEQSKANDDAVVDGLLGASRVLLALAARSIAQLGIDVTLVQLRALVVLASRGPQRTVDLADELRVAPSTVTRMVDRLSGKGMVRRYRRRDDRRATWVILTESGRDLVGEVMQHRRDAIAEAGPAGPGRGPGWAGHGSASVRRSGRRGTRPAVVAALERLCRPGSRCAGRLGDHTQRDPARAQRQIAVRRLRRVA